MKKYAAHLLVLAFVTATLLGAFVQPGVARADCPPVMNVVASPTSIDFGNQLVGTTSIATVTLTYQGSCSTGDSNVLAEQADIRGPFQGFNAVITVPDIFPSGQSGQVMVGFTPSDVGLHQATLAIKLLDQTLTWNTMYVPLQGTGAEPGATLSPTSLDFGNQFVGTLSAEQKASLTNTGGWPLSITSITASGDYGETNDCGVTVAAGASCSISVTFKPTAGGTRTGAITINDDAPSSTQQVALTGNGVFLADLALSVSATPNPVRATTDLLYVITVMNAGPSLAPGTMVSDPLPAGTVFVSASPSQGSCLAPAVDAIGTMTCDLGTLPIGGTASISLVVRVTAAGGATLSNTASVSYSGPDSNTSNNSATITTRVYGSRH